MLQMARNLLDCEDGFLRNATHLIHDRDPLFTKAWRDLLGSQGVQCARIPASSPNCKGYASYCTSLIPFDATGEKRRRSESLRPWSLVGAASPGGS